MAVHEPDSLATQRAAVDPGGRLTLFSYTVESLSPLYRAVVRLFLEAKELFRLDLRAAAALE